LYGFDDSGENEGETDCQPPPLTPQLAVDFSAQLLKSYSGPTNATPQRFFPTTNCAGRPGDGAAQEFLDSE
jgi:hypothetical protein